MKRPNRLSNPTWTESRRSFSSMVRNRTVAEDVVQEVFVKAWRGLPAFEGRSELSTWLYRIAMNTVHQYFEREGRQRVIDGVSELATLSREQPPDGAVMQLELQDEITAAIDELTPKLRAAIVLVVMRGVDAAEAAEIEGCTQSTMYWRVHEARRRIKKSLEGYMT